MEQKINVKEVLSTFDKAINKLEKGIEPNLLSKNEQMEVNVALTETIRLGLKVKLQYQQRKIEGLIKSLEENQQLDLAKIQLISKKLEKALKMNEAA